MGRLIQEKIKQPLAEELLFGKLVHGGEVTVKMKDGALSFAIEAAAPEEAARRRARPSGRARRSQSERERAGGAMPPALFFARAGSP